MLGRFGLIVYDSSEPATKALGRAIFTRELESPRHDDDDWPPTKATR